MLASKRCASFAGMLFLPLKPNFPLRRLPWLTMLVCVVCLAIFGKQQIDRDEYAQAIYAHCDEQRSHIKVMVLNRIAPDSENACVTIVHGIALSVDEESAIQEIVSGIRPITGFDAEETRVYVSNMLADEMYRYHLRVPEDPDAWVAYETSSWNPVQMFMSAFGHADWAHVIFNVIFFAAFAAAVEVMLGTVMFIISFVSISVVTGIFSSLSGMISGQHFTTLGLSGVVMGMIGLFAYLLPRGQMLCGYWFLVFIGKIAVPVWALALYFIGGDIYQLLTSDDHGMVNVLAHVTGGVGGFLFGLAFLKKKRWEMSILQAELAREKLRPGT
jgi:membrane associated rhomboid family serine protease